MIEARYQVGETFQLQFVWRIPDADILRAIFEVKILHRDAISMKYVVLLTTFKAGRQENGKGVMRSIDEVTRDYWAMVAGLAGNRISVAYEADDGRPLWLRFETLTGEHNFFTRLDELPQYIDPRKREEF